MRKLIPLLLLASRGLAICAVLAGLGAGLLNATIGSSFVCFDSCPSPWIYFANQGPAAVQEMAPCVALELLALATFVAYCLATRQARRAASQAVVLLVGGLVGVTALSAFMLAGQASLPLTWEGYFAGSASLEAWQGQWGLALMIVAGAWSAVLAYLQWAAT